MRTRQSVWMCMLASLAAIGADATIGNEFRIGVQVGAASWRMGVDTDTDVSSMRQYHGYEPDTHTPTGIVGQYIARFDIDDLKVFGGIEVAVGIDAEVTTGGKRATIRTNETHFGDFAFGLNGMRATKVADAVCLVGLGLGRVTVFGGRGVAYAEGQADLSLYSLEVTDYHGKGSHRGSRRDVGVEVDLGASVVLQVRASRTDYGSRAYRGLPPENDVADLDVSEYVATLLYRF